MLEMALVSEKRLKYVGNDVDMLEMAKICWKMTEIFNKRLKYWEMTYRFGKWLKSLCNGLDI